MDARTRTPGEIDAGELKRMLDRGETPFVIDLRNDEEFRRWRIEGRQPLQVIHVPYYEILAEAEEDDLTASAKAYARRHWVDDLPREGRIVVVCAHGGTSGYVAQAPRAGL